MVTRRRYPMVLASVTALGGMLVATGPAQAATAAAVAVAAAPPSTVAGYYANHSTYTSVAADWVQPAASCTSPTASALFWVGLDGITSSTIEQIGTEVVCSGSVPAYYAWYEVYPAAPVVLSGSVKPGDEIRASVVYTAPSKYTLTITNATEGWTSAVVKSLAAARSSAEIFVQGPGTGGSLANFGEVSFVNCLIDGAPLEDAGPTAVNMVSSTGILQALSSALTSPTSFNVTWEHA
jgi:exosome complex RNA-binding protein Csl4